jgi:hypothetical protein
MKGISNAHWAAEAPSCQEQGLYYFWTSFVSFPLLPSYSDKLVPILLASTS